MQRLHTQGVSVRAGSRSGQPGFDWQDQSTWAPALAGTTAAYVSCFPDLAAEGAHEAIAAFPEQAPSVGTQRLVLRSGRGEIEAQRAEQGPAEHAGGLDDLRPSNLSGSSLSEGAVGRKNQPSATSATVPPGLSASAHLLSTDEGAA